MDRIALQRAIHDICEVLLFFKFHTRVLTYLCNLGTPQILAALTRTTCAPHLFLSKCNIPAMLHVPA